MKNKKAKSKSQRRLMGWSQACKSGKTDNCPSNIVKVADTMKSSDLKSMSKTKEVGKPERVSQKKESHILDFNQFLIELLK